MLFFKSEMEKRIIEPVFKPKMLQDEKEKIISQFSKKKEKYLLDMGKHFGVLIKNMFDVLHESECTSILAFQLFQATLLTFVSLIYLYFHKITIILYCQSKFILKRY